MLYGLPQRLEVSRKAHQAKIGKLCENLVTFAVNLFLEFENLVLISYFGVSFGRATGMENNCTRTFDRCRCQALGCTRCLPPSFTQNQ